VKKELNLRFSGGGSVRSSICQVRSVYVPAVPVLSTSLPEAWANLHGAPSEAGVLASRPHMSASPASRD